MSRPTKAKVNLEALRHNYLIAKELSGGKVAAVVKANAYSHGAIDCAQALADITDSFAVACIEEALELRCAGIKNTIILLEGFFDPSEIDLIQQHQLDTVVHCEEQLAILESKKINKNIRVWLKMDSGMGRVGFLPSFYHDAWQRLHGMPFIKDIVLMSHLSCADELNSNKTAQQLKVFEKYTHNLPGEKSMANSAGIIAFPTARFQWSRPGLMLYGVSPFPNNHFIEKRLKPVMELHSAVISVKEIPIGSTVGYGGRWVAKRPTKLGVIPIGYADGYPRHAIDTTPVLIKNYKVPLVGRVSMDMITVDMTEIVDVSVGDDVTLWGEGLPVTEIANYADTIPYQLLCNLNRVPIEHINQLR